MARALCSSLDNVIIENVEVLRAGFGEVQSHESALSACLSDVKVLISELEIDLGC